MATHGRCSFCRRSRISSPERWEFEMNSRTALYCADIAVHPVLLVAAVVWTAPIDPSEMPMWLACFSIGVFAWTLAEYLMHRFAFHRLPIIYDLHKAHHDDPRAHLGSPFWIGVPLLAATLALLISVGGRSAGGGTGTGLIAGYLWYLCLHHAIHHSRFTRSSYLRRAKRTHSRHHYSPVECNFGVTTRLWDRAFKTEFRQSETFAR